MCSHCEVHTPEQQQQLNALERSIRALTALVLLFAYVGAILLIAAMLLLLAGAVFVLMHRAGYY